MKRDAQMMMLERVNAQRERRLARALAACERQRQEAVLKMNAQSREHAAAAVARTSEIAALSKQYGKPQHLWAYTRACDHHVAETALEEQNQREAQSDLREVNAQHETAQHAQVAAQRRSAKMAELKKHLTTHKREPHV